MKKHLEIDQLPLAYLYLAIFTTITILAWVGFEVFRSLTTPVSLETVTAEELRPLQEVLDPQALNLVRERLHIDQAELDALEVAPVTLDTQAEVFPATESATIETLISSPSAEAEDGGDF